MSLRLGRAWFAAVSVLAAAAGCSRTPSPATLSHEAYVWQRLWPAELAEAVREAPREIETLHVLARELGGTPRAATDARVDVAALAASGRDVVAVMRIAGTAPLDQVTVLDMAALAAAWRRQGVRVHGIEIDHDCASARLPAYRDWLGRARAALPGLSLTITALPTWLGAQALTGVVAMVDEAAVGRQASLSVGATAAARRAEPARAGRVQRRATRRPGQAVRLGLGPGPRIT